MTVPSAAVVADSISPAGHRLRSVQVTAHRFILAEINTHRMLSRSYRSSRAVPVKKLLEEVRTNPAMPVFWGQNQGGMQAREELSSDREADGRNSPRERAEREWFAAAESAATHAEDLAFTGLHKQIANRVLEPFLWVHGIITATEWDNFFGLRLHEDAQPEFRALADAIWAAFKSSEPRRLEPGQWHLPFIDVDDGLEDFREPWYGQIIKRSVGRCARSSYNSFDTGKRSTIEEDLATYAKLNIPGTEFYDPTKPIHASPAEHQGTPDEIIGNHIVGYLNNNSANPIWAPTWQFGHQHGNFVGFRQYRKMLPGEAVAPLPPAYQPERQSQ